MSAPWSIDRIAHALASPELRQRFLTQVNLVPVHELPTIIDCWIAIVDPEAAHARIEEFRAYFAAHGELPAGYEAVLVDMTDRIQDEAARLRRAA